MSVLIKGIDIPIDCWNCVCVDKEFGKCQVTDTTIYGDIPKWCPLIEIQTQPEAEVVRCKDCVYWKQATDNSGNCNRAFEITTYWSDFCIYGERREDAT